MSHPEVTFLDRASRLARNPLGIIALFICFLYSMASLTLGLASGITEGQRWVLIVFLCLFPLVVLWAYFVLVTKHASALYAPTDFEDERIFLRLIDQRQRQAREISTMMELERGALVPVDVIADGDQRVGGKGQGAAE